MREFMELFHGPKSGVHELIELFAFAKTAGLDEFIELFLSPEIRHARIY
jgi:hypothetical protein